MSDTTNTTVEIGLDSIAALTRAGKDLADAAKLRDLLARIEGSGWYTVHLSITDDEGDTLFNSTTAEGNGLSTLNTRNLVEFLTLHCAAVEAYAKARVESLGLKIAA